MIRMRSIIRTLGVVVIAGCSGGGVDSGDLDVQLVADLNLNTESQIERALDVVLEGRTAIIIAHRLATARRADRIGVIHDGRIVELGSHDELVAIGGRYASMFDTWVAHGGAAS